jgi:RHS repeat-associated protein
MKDQVGNIRMTFTANGTGVTVLQRDEYYPFGNTFDSYLGSGGANTYKFNGMEFEENNLNTFDFHARMYDPQIGRSFQPDPHADFYADKSPFSFLANNPISFTDPTGMDEEGDGNGGGGGGGGSTDSGITPWFLSSGGYSSVSNGRPGRGDLYYDYVRGTYKLDGVPISNAQAMALIKPYLAPIMKETIDIYVLYPDGTRGLSNTYYKYSVGAEGVQSNKDDLFYEKIQRYLDSQPQSGRLEDNHIIEGTLIPGSVIKTLYSLLYEVSTPKPSPNFRPPTNPPQPPTNNAPNGWNVRIMKPTEQYPNGYWILEKPMENGGMQPINPSTMRPGPRWDTHIPLPKGWW